MNWQTVEQYWKKPLADVLGMMFNKYQTMREVQDALDTSSNTLVIWLCQCKVENPALDGDTPSAIGASLAWRYRKRAKRN